MSKRVFVGMTYSDPAFVWGVGLALLGLVMALVAAACNLPQVLIFVLAMGTGLGLVLAVVRQQKISQNWRWLTPTDTGFLLFNNRGEFEFFDNMVSHLATWVRTVYPHGSNRLSRRTGNFILTARGESVTLAFEYCLPHGEPDPLGDMFARVLTKLVEKAKASVQNGGQLVGDGWWLENDRLRYLNGKEEVSLPLGNISYLDLSDIGVCIWRKGETEAVLRVPVDSLNAQILGHVLQDLLTPNTLEEPPDGLGRLFFERDESIRGVFLMFWVALILSLVAGGVFMLLWIDFPTGLLGLALIGGSVWGVIRLVRNQTNILRCHAFGIAHITLWGVTKLPYKSLGTFSSTDVHEYVEDRYVSTTTTMQFVPLPGVNLEPISFSTMFKHDDMELEDLRDLVCREMAEPMLRRLREGEPVRWIPGFTFQLEGLVINREGRSRVTGDVDLIPYEEILHQKFEKGVFSLYTKRWPGHAVQVNTSQPNFFPGFALLTMILHPTTTLKA